MTVTSNIHIGLSAWQASHAYSSLGARISNGGNAYQVIGTGTSAGSGGPTGTGGSITDNTVSWKYLSGIDYTSLPAWVSSIPGTVTQPIVGLLWNDGPITTTAGTEYFSLAGHNGSSVNTITLGCAPGESFRDTLANQTTALAFNTANGVCFTLPSGAGGINYIQITDSNVIFQGLQFQDPNSTSNCSIIGTVTGSTNFVITDSIVDGYAQVGAIPIDLFSAPDARIINTLIVDRQTGNIFGPLIDLSGAGSALINSTLVNLSGNTNGSAVDSAAVSGAFMTNCAVYGYSVPFTNGTVAVDHSAFSASSVGSGATSGSGNIFSTSAANQFVNSSTDFRLKSGADCLNAGATDTTDIPTADDIVGTHRPAGTAWDIGCWEFVSAVTASETATVPTLRAAATATNIGDFASARDTLTALSCVATITLFDQLHSATSIETVRAAAVVNQFTQVNASPSLEAISPVATMNSFTRAVAANTIALSAVVTVTNNNSFTSVSYLEVLTAQVTTFQSDNVSATLSLEVLVPQIVAARTTPASSLDTIPTLTGSGQAALTTPVTAANSILGLSPIANLSQATAFTNNIIVLPISSKSFVVTLSGFNTSASINFRAAGSLTLGTSVSTIIKFTATAAMTSLTDASFVNTIPISAKSVATQFDLASAINSIEVVTASASTIQQNDASAVNTIAAMGEVCILGISMNARNTVCALRSVAAAGEFNLATAADTILSLTTPQVIPLFLQTEDFHTIATDTAGTLLKGDIFFLNAFQSVTQAGLATVMSLTSSVSAFVDTVASLLISINVTPVVSLTQFNSAAGGGILPGITSRATVGYKLIGTTNLLNLSVGRLTNKLIMADPFDLVLMVDPASLNTAIQEDFTQPQLLSTVTCALTQTLTIVSVAGTALSSDVAHGSKTLNFAAIGQLNQSQFASSIDAISFTASSSSVLTTPTIGSANIDLTDVCSMASSTNASSLDAIPPLSVVANALVGNFASGVNTISALSATALVSFALGAINDVNFSASGQMTSNTNASATLTIDGGIQCAAAAQQFNLCSGSDNIDLRCTSTPGQNDLASFIDTFAVLGVVATASVNGSQVATVSTIVPMSAAGSVAQGNHSDALAQLRLLATAGAHLWQTPEEYTEGESMVWWSD